MSEQMPQFSEIQQKTFPNGVDHAYGVDHNGKMRHISHDAVLESYGYSADEAKQNVPELQAAEVPIMKPSAEHTTNTRTEGGADEDKGRIQEHAKWQLNVDTAGSRPSDRGVTTDDVAYNMWLGENAAGETESKSLMQVVKDREAQAEKDKKRDYARLSMRVKTGVATADEIAYLDYLNENQPKTSDTSEDEPTPAAPAVVEPTPIGSVEPTPAEPTEPKPAVPATTEPAPTTEGKKKNNSGISDEELAALGNNDEFEGLSSEELRALGIQAREEALNKFKRARMNKAAVNRLAKKLGLSEEEVATLQARMNEPITENDVRPPARREGDTEKLKPENIGSLDKSELNKYLNLELNRNRFNNHDAETARNKAEQVLRKLAEQQGWTEEKLENELKVLNEYVALEPKDTSEQPHPGYAGPVPKGMEVEHVEPDQVQRKRLRERLSDRWANARTRTNAAIRGDVTTAFGPRNPERQEGLSRRQKIALGLGAVAGATLVVLLATKRIDINPFDHDIDHTIDLDPFNGDNQQVPGYALAEDAKGDVVPKVRGEQTSYDVFRKAGVDHPTLNHIFDNPDDFLRQSEWIQAEIAKGRDPKEVEEQLLNFYDSVKK